jgi:hypothetical protein
MGDWAPVAMGHVWTAPGCQGFRARCSLVVAAMCSAFRCGSDMTAGPYAFRGSGPGHYLAFEMPWPMWVVPITGSTGSA